MAGNDNEKRRSTRRRILKRAVIAYSDRHCTLPCTVRDISESGARLQLTSTVENHFAAEAWPMPRVRGDSKPFELRLRSAASMRLRRTCTSWRTLLRSDYRGALEVVAEDSDCVLCEGAVVVAR